MSEPTIADARLGRSMFVRVGDDEYLAWSSVCDAPISFMLTGEEVQRLMDANALFHYGEGITDEQRKQFWAARWERLQKLGTTEMLTDSAEGTYGFNRAGPREEHLTLDALKRMYRDSDSYNKFELREGDVIPNEDED